MRFLETNKKPANHADTAVAREYEKFDVLEYMRESQRPIPLKRKRGPVRAAARLVWSSLRALWRGLCAPTQQYGYAPSWWAAIVVLSTIALLVIVNAKPVTLLGLIK